MTDSIVVFTNQLLPYSETFIRAQGEALNDFNAHYVGSYGVANGLLLATERSYLIRQGKLGAITDNLLKLGILCPWLKRTVGGLQPQLIHAHFGPNGLSALPLAKALNVPLITTFHGFDATIEQPTKAVHGRLHLRFMHHRKTLASQGDVFIAVSDFIKQKLLELGFPAERVVRHYIGINTDFFCPEPQVKRDNSVLIVARLVAYKGHRYLLQAMAKVQQKFPDSQLVLVGDGPEREALEQQAMQLGLNIDFAGKQSPEQVRHRMRQARVYCQTSVRLDNGHEEALALAIAEAQAVGTPAVVFNSGGMPEAVNAKQSGFVVEPADVDDLAARISELLSDHQRWQQFSDAAVAYIRAVHNLNEQNAKLEQLYQQCLQQFNNCQHKEMRYDYSNAR
ncbi:glycosyl transferase family 1 [Neiella marina]|uniref:Glycosyl transferase family 1 n=1 Tax=Neiella marina TaxID=508461 RepID=A0A8J2U1X9_9GAMM|nr:glycosyltransferase [Neiella marina]GGA64533.1 glycosyl transferase family 1 [Neiella marina]